MPAFDKTVEVNLRGLPADDPARGAADGEERRRLDRQHHVDRAVCQPQADETTYAITKTGVISLTKSFARELGPKGIRVNAIAPGVVETRFAEAVLDTEEKRRHWREWLPVGRHGQPADIAGRRGLPRFERLVVLYRPHAGGRRRRAGGVSKERYDFDRSSLAAATERRLCAIVLGAMPVRRERPWPTRCRESGPSTGRRSS